jgi:cell division protein FtsI/penicillin-binding protein 2
VPAASVFKIVTAAASIERNKYTRESIVLYDGGKHTLYKGNVVREPDRGLHKASLEEGFAQSVNSVFGKLGIYTMLPEELVSFSEKLLFNKEIPFDLPIGPSNFSLEDPEDPFLLAELSSGFNRTTTVSPLHAALIVSSVYKGGLMPAPYLVTEARDRHGNILYKGKEGTIGRVMSKDTAEELKALMSATILSGTGRREYYDKESHPILSKLIIGGKSGTINDKEGNHVDWFVAFAHLKGKKGKEARPLALAGVVVHAGRTRTTSQELTRKAILSYYGPILKEGK